MENGSARDLALKAICPHASLVDFVRLYPLRFHDGVMSYDGCITCDLADDGLCKKTKGGRLDIKGTRRCSYRC